MINMSINRSWILKSTLIMMKKPTLSRLLLLKKKPFPPRKCHPLRATLRRTTNSDDGFNIKGHDQLDKGDVCIL